MFLNDAFDARYDQQHRPDRPIPSGAMSAAAVWRWGFGWIALGLLSLGLVGVKTAVCGSVLAACILVYNGMHKIFAFSPVIMAACRFLLILAAASAAADGITGLTIWSALVLACYVAGVSAFARRETVEGSLRYWPVILLLAPVVLALIIDRGPYLGRGLILSLVLTLWILRSLRYVYWAEQRNIPHGVAGLLAGIVLVDLLALAGGTVAVGFALAALFVLALLLQRLFPAT